MLDDPLVREKVTKKIAESYLNIEWIFNEVIEEIANQLQESDNHYFKDRAPDVISIGQKVLKNLLGNRDVDIPDKVLNPIVVAHTLSPPEVVYLYKKNVKGFILEIGGRTSHVAIMARDLKIPAVMGVTNITKRVRTGDRIIADGNFGTVIINPEKDTSLLYTHKEKQLERYQKSLKKIEKKTCALKGGEEIALLFNMDVEEELEMIMKSNCKGIGLFRTEYMFLNRNQSPTEEEQYEIYKKIVQALDPYEVTIRIIDVGGDKKPPYMDYYEEKNPFLGWRGIRYVLSHKDLFKEQVRAILKASHFGNSRIMFPMVNDIDEIEEVLNIVDECKKKLSEENVPFKKNIELGIMVETPSSTILLDKIADYVDFLSVGTNDLIQYTLAIDRGNGMVAGDFDPGHPAILRLLKSIRSVSQAKGVEVSICGEMAGDPLYTLLLIGLGYRKLSMSSMSIPIIKHIIIHSSMQDAAEIATNALEFSSKKKVGRYLREQMIMRFADLEDYFIHNA